MNGDSFPVVPGLFNKRDSSTHKHSLLQARYLFVFMIGFLIAGCKKEVDVNVLFGDENSPLAAKNVRVVFNGEDGEARTAYTDQNGTFKVTFDQDPGKVRYWIYMDNPSFSWRVNGCDTAPVWSQGTIGPFSKDITQVTLTTSDVDTGTIWNYLQVAKSALDSANTNVSQKLIPVCPGQKNAYNKSLGTITVNVSPSLPYRDQTIWHEYGHAVMAWAAGGAYNSGDCSAHGIRKITDTTCAWVEGWADFFALYVGFTQNPNREPRFRGDDMEQYWSDVRGKDGEKDEGRVAAGLWDLFDKPDDCSLRNEPIYGNPRYCDENSSKTVSVALMLHAMYGLRFSPTVEMFYQYLRPLLPDERAQAEADRVMYHNYLMESP